MIKVTRWSPDTCNCVIEYSWDDSVPQDQRVHTLKSVVGRGAEHIGLDDATVWATVLAENQTKNRMLPLAQSVKPSIDVPTWLGKVSWSFSGPGTTRLLTLKFGSLLTAAEKVTLQSLSDVTFGAGKVSIL